MGRLWLYDWQIVTVASYLVIFYCYFFQKSSPEAPTNLVCIVCKSRDDNPLKKFVDKSWCTFKTSASCRLLLKSDRYRDVTTEVNLMREMGNKLYHSKCYKNFTAVKRSPSVSPNDEPPQKKAETRRSSSMPESDSRGLLKGSCIFCTVVRKTINRKVERLSDCLTKDGCDAIVAAAPRSSNERIKSLVLSGVDLIAKEAQYHKSCRREFFREFDNQPESTETSNKQLHKATFEALSQLIEEYVIGDGRSMLATSLMELYKREYLNSGGTEDAIDSYTVQALMKKVMDRFGNKVTISLYNHRKGNYIYRSDKTEGEARASLHNDEERNIHMIRTTALYLRSVIQTMPKWETPTPTSMSALKGCSPDIPDEVILFFKTLMNGIHSPSCNENKDVLDRKVLAMASDAVYNTSRGGVRPWKHTVLGLGVGTLTGSKLILQILNRLGYSLSYDEVKSLETEFAYTVEENDRDAPDGVKNDPNLGTGLAWDNYDVNMETVDGKDTLHATVGICYQNVTDTMGPVNSTVTDKTVSSNSRGGRNRRNFDGKERVIEPYYKPIKKATFDLSPLSRDHGNGQKPILKIIDFHWLLKSEVARPIPLFPGFYSQFTHDHLPLQKIWYMEPISAPPTRNEVVRETMKRAMNVANEAGQQYGVVTYDLAVALKAYSIQSLDAPDFDKLLIMLGNFHLELAFYGALGTYINESGAQHLLTESGILAEGSLMGFINGKYYNRCVRIHEILALAMERKMYESFMSTLPKDKQDDIKDLLLTIPEAVNDQQAFLATSQIFLEHMNQYELFFHDVMNGKLGPTAQYWGMYIFMVNRVHRDLMRALRTNDIDAYISVLPWLIDIFFGLNRPNYARWGVLFLDKLMAMDPECHTVLQSGAFSIRRTRKNFARSAIDLTLEQTVNRDAASPMRGIVGFHYSQNAITRWCITSTQRGMSVTELRTIAGLEAEEQPAAQLRASRIEKDSQHRDILINAITESCDPFSLPSTECPCLLNIATGKAAKPETQNYLIESLAEGRNLHMKFQEECAADKHRFLKPIKRRKVLNFAQENLEKKSSNVKGKCAAESLRDVFIRILVVISQKMTFNLQHVMSFPLTEFPLSITHSDGSRIKTDKSKLLKKLEELQCFSGPLQLAVNATLIDGGLLIHSYLSAIGNISSYGHLARNLLDYVCTSQGEEVHVLFDTYCPMSLKEGERELRGANDHPFIIAGPEQSPRQNCHKLLLNGRFKDELATFLIKEWQNDQYGPILGNKTLVVSHGGNCIIVTYNKVDSKMTVDRPVHLQGNHEEADTLLAFHAAHTTGNIVIRASDTDVMVVILGMLGRHILNQCEVSYENIIMDCGSGNSRRYIDVSSIATTLESEQRGLAAAMPALHAFTGCDITAAFYRKGKLRPLDIVRKNVSNEMIEFFITLSNGGEPDKAKAEEFICAIYGMKGITKDVNEARYLKLLQMTGNNKKVNMAIHHSDNIFFRLHDFETRYVDNLCIMKPIYQWHFLTLN